MGEGGELLLSASVKGRWGALDARADAQIHPYGVDGLPLELERLVQIAQCGHVAHGATWAEPFGRHVNEQLIDQLGFEHGPVESGTRFDVHLVDLSLCEISGHEGQVHLARGSHRSHHAARWWLTGRVRMAHHHHAARPEGVEFVLECMAQVRVECAVLRGQTTSERILGVLHAVHAWPCRPVRDLVGHWVYPQGAVNDHFSGNFEHFGIQGKLQLAVDHHEFGLARGGYTAHVKSGLVL